MANKQSSKDLRKIRRRLDTLLDGTETDQVEVCLPVSLTRKYLAEYTPTGIAEVEWTEFARYVVSRVVVATLNEDFKRGGSIGKWVPLSYEVFKSLATAKYKVMQAALVTLGIIECDESYSYKQHKTYGYRLGKHYRKQPIKFRYLKASKVLKKLQAWNRSELQKQKERISAIAHVAKGWLDYQDISIDQKMALEFLQRYREVMLQEVKARLDMHRTGKAERSKQAAWVHNQYLHARHRVEQWEQVPTISVDDSGGRFYHPLVGLLSPLRNFVTYKGDTLVSFDLKNSQPLHLLMVMQSEFWNEKSRLTWSLKKLDEEMWTATREGRQGRSKGQVISPLIESQISSQRLDEEGGAVTHFAELVLSGKLYEFMVEKFRGRFVTSKRIDRFGTRELAKSEMLRLMYFNNANRRSNAQQPFEEFRQFFPGVASVMDLLKRRNYTDFPILLQKLEAHMMLEKVSRRIYERNPTTWFTTIHDSVVTVPEHASLVQDVIRATYEEVLNATPAIERTDLHPDAAFDGLFDYVQRKIDKNIGEGENREVRDSRQQVEHWLRTQLTGVDGLLVYPFSESADTSVGVNPFEVAEDGSEVSPPKG